MTVSIQFERVRTGENEFKLNAEINIGEHTETDIEVTWARLSMGYLHDIFNAMKLDASRHVADTGASLVFYGSYEDTLDEDDEDFSSDWNDEEYDENEDYDHDGSMASMARDSNVSVSDLSDLEAKASDLSRRIGFRLNVGDAYKRIGGLAAPSVVAAHTLYNALVMVRNRVCVQQS